MLAESVHSIADSGNELLLLLGRSRSRRSQTEEHQFGFGAERYFWTFIVAMVLFTVGALFSIYDGYHRITHPEPVSNPVVAFVVLAVALGLESFSFRTAITEINQLRAGRSVGTFIRQAKAPELPAVLLEDTAALIGLIFAFAGVTLSTVTHDGRFDGAGSVAVGVLLGCVAVVLAAEMKSLLIGESASAGAEAAIVAAIEASPQIERVIHLRTLHVGPENLLVTAKIAVRPDERAAVLAAAIDAAEGRIRAAVPIAQLIFLEPDVYTAGRADDTDPAIRAARRSSPRRPRR